MPVFIIPPLVGLISAIAGMRRSRPEEASHLEWIAIVSMLNLILSVVFLYRFHFSPAEILEHFANVVWSLIAAIMSIAPDQAPPAKLIPVSLPI